MDATLPADIQELVEALNAAERDARELIEGLAEGLGAWCEGPGSWSVAECLDHLATANRVYLEAMRPVADRALRQGRVRRGPARPGVVGGWFVWSLEPPVNVRFRTKAPGKIRPRTAPALSDAVTAFFSSHEEARSFLRTYAGIDLAGASRIHSLLAFASAWRPGCT